MASSKLIKSAFLFCLLQSSLLFSQNSSLGLSANFLQTDEFYNGGLVFGGPELTVEFNYQMYNKRDLINISGSVSGGAVFSHGIAGFSVNIKPLQTGYYFFITENNNFRIYAGADFTADYSMQLYPDIQSGLNFWLSSFYLSPAIKAELPRGSGIVILSLSVSAAGFISRTPAGRDPHFFSLKFTDFLSDLHSDLRSVSIGDFTKISIETGYLFSKNSLFSFNYGLDYFGYNDLPEYKSLRHKLFIRFGL